MALKKAARNAARVQKPSKRGHRRRRLATSQRRGTMRLEDAVRRLDDAVAQCCRDIEIQFKRTAQIQQELDEIRSAWTRVTPKLRASR